MSLFQRGYLLIAIDQARIGCAGFQSKLDQGCIGGTTPAMQPGQGKVRNLSGGKPLLA
jgi:hypothetical protein